MCRTIASLPFAIAAVLMFSKSNGSIAILLGIILGVGIIKMDGIGQREIVYIISSCAVGIICGMGYVACAAYYTAVYSICAILAEKTSAFKPKSSLSTLNIGISQMEDYNNAFDDIFEKYLSYCKMVRVKADEQYDRYNVEYLIEVKKGACEKSFMDAIRARNGNLSVAITKDCCKKAA